jgi:hypothetical protein
MLSKPREHKHFGLLLEAAQLLHACEIPPVAWVLFSFDVWPLTVNAHVPSPSFVFSPKRIQERHDWFEDSRGGYGKVQIKYGNQHIALISSWDGMWDDLLRSRPETRQEVAAVVERWFPGASFEQRVNSAKLEARRLQLEIDRQVIEGAVLWR